MSRRTFVPSCLTVLVVSILLANTSCSQPDTAQQSSRPPNVILVMTDDQGYGDIGALGNTMIETPNLDQLHAESVRLTNYHVDPTCSPTRSALLSGRYESRSLPAGATETTFQVTLEEGPASLQTWLTLADGQTRGTYFVYLKHL